MLNRLSVYCVRIVFVVLINISYGQLRILLLWMLCYHLKLARVVRLFALTSLSKGCVIFTRSAYCLTDIYLSKLFFFCSFWCCTVKRFCESCGVCSISDALY